MLARSKRRPRDEEPLVPHGLISQALDASQPALEDASATQPAKFARARILHWPRAAQHFRNTAGIAGSLRRRIDAIRKHLQLFSFASQVRNFASTRAKQIRGGLAFTSSILGRLSVVLSSVRLSTRVADFRRLTSARAQRTLGLYRVWSAQTLVHSRRLTSASLHWVKQARTQIHFAEATARAGLRLRIHLSGFPLQARIALARASSEWNLRRESLARNSRLWASLALGAVSALIVMGIFITARHYAQASLPSKRNASASSTQSGNAAAPTTVAPVMVNTHNGASAQTSLPPITLTKAKPTPRKLSRAAVAPHRRIHHNEDEDYVAKDTYVYYGKNPAGHTKPATD
jgi:hypothetical protein